MHEALRSQILALTKEYVREVHADFAPRQTVSGQLDDFRPGVDFVPYAGRVFAAEEVVAAVDSALDFWLTLGPHGRDFESALAERLGVAKSILVNSGSSANLLAVSATTSHRLGSERAAEGSEVITVAAGFPTTVAPIVQAGLRPVFIDVDPHTMNANVDMLEEAYAPGLTSGVMLAHTLGNPFDLAAVVEFCTRHDLWLIEDNCDALGSRYRGQPTGSFGDLSTQSFYPPHHMTMGEGGAVNIRGDARLRRVVESLRDWGRDCWCPSGEDDTCKKRFGWQLGELPFGFDHKYTYSHLGYNLKPLDLQAAIGTVQLARVDAFSEQRKRNWQRLRRNLSECDDVFDFMLPTGARAWTEEGFLWSDAECKCDPSWFGFLLRVRDAAPFGRTELAAHLARRRIGTRMLFGGNLVKQPAFQQLAADQPNSFRVVGELGVTDAVLQDALFLGVYPGLSAGMLDYVAECVTEFTRRF